MYEQQIEQVLADGTTKAFWFWQTTKEEDWEYRKRQEALGLGEVFWRDEKGNAHSRFMRHEALVQIGWDEFGGERLPRWNFK